MKRVRITEATRTTSDTGCPDCGAMNRCQVHDWANLHWLLGWQLGRNRDLDRQAGATAP